MTKPNKPTKPLETRVQQQHRDDVNINNIVKKYIGGSLPSGNPLTPMYMDISGYPTYHEMLNITTKAEQDFMQFPAKIRSQFGNKAENLINFISDNKNREKAQELGLIPKPEPEEGPGYNQPVGTKIVPAKPTQQDLAFQANQKILEQIEELRKTLTPEESK